jgi:flagellar biosynthesis protein FlhA
VPDTLSVGEIQRVLQGLLREGVSIRDLGAIVEAVGDKARLTRDAGMLSEYARQAIARTIVAPFLDPTGTVHAIALDPATEQHVAESLVQTADGEFLALDPNRAQLLVESAAVQVDAALAQGVRPVLLCSARVRRHLRLLVEQRLPQLAVCSYNEIVPGVSVETSSVLTLGHAAADGVGMATVGV